MFDNILKKLSIATCCVAVQAAFVSATASAVVVAGTTDTQAGADSLTAFEPFGVCTHWNELRRFALAKEAGIQWIRVDLSWNHVEPAQGGWNWEPVDAAMEEAQAQGLKVLGIIGYTPLWAASGDSRNYAALEQYDPQWREFVDLITTRYADKVDVWEVWNEPDHNHFLRVGPGSWAVETHPDASAQIQKRLQYLHNVNIALDVIKEKGLTVSTSGFAMGGSYDSGFIDWLVGQGDWLAQFDIFNFHMYGWPQHEPLINTIQKIRTVQTEIGRVTPLWITEHGITDLGVSDSTVRDYLIKSYALALGDGVDKLFWFRLMPGGKHMTLLDDRGQPTAAYRAYKTLATHWKDCRVITRWQSDGLGVHGSVAELQDGKTVAVLWADSPVAVSALTATVTAAFDADGNALALTELTLGASPVILYLD